MQAVWAVAAVIAFLVGDTNRGDACVRSDERHVNVLITNR